MDHKIVVEFRSADSLEGATITVGNVSVVQLIIATHHLRKIVDKMEAMQEMNAMHEQSKVIEVARSITDPRIAGGH